MSLLIKILVFAIIMYILIVTVKFVRIILIVALGIIYIPINNFYLIVQKWHFHMKKKDPVIYYAFTPFYWILVAITYIVAAPYEFISTLGLH